MEEELRCPHCTSYYHVPVLLQCHHALCLSCAVSLQKAISPSGSSASDTVEDNAETEDKLSVLSDADSGVSSCGSRPTSIVSGSDPGSDPASPPAPAFTVECPRCRICTPTDETGAHCLLRYRVLAAVVDKHLERFQVTEPCQMCDVAEHKPLSTSGRSKLDTRPENVSSSTKALIRQPTSETAANNTRENSQQRPNAAEVFCDQCLVFYCNKCRLACHPARGPLAAHWLVGVAEGRALLRARRREMEGKCSLHTQETMSMYCITCRRPVCVLCLHRGRHHGHDVHALNAITKVHKTELSQSLQQLSERARKATDFIHVLKQLSEEVHDNCSEAEAVLVAQIDAVQTALDERRKDLLEWLQVQKQVRAATLQEQVVDYTTCLQSTTGTLHFCIEALKEADPASFMETQDVLEERVFSLSAEWSRSMRPEPRAEVTFDFTLDDKSLLDAINKLTFVQLKPPLTPMIHPNECSAENNSVTVAWTPHDPNAVKGYVLHIDDGEGGMFREVYSGEETVCTIDGLHFNSMYRAKVQAYNNAGHSSFSDSLCLQTSQVAWFCLSSTHPDVNLSNGSCQMHCASYEHRVALGSVGFSKGCHYWRFVLDEYDGNADIAFGIARKEVFNEEILGKCSLSWSMYIDGERSWLMHEGQHFSRRGSGVQKGDSVGVLMNLEEGCLTFFVNEDEQGCLLLSGLSGIIYPALSLNRSTILTLQSGLSPPGEGAITPSDDESLNTL